MGFRGLNGFVCCRCCYWLWICSFGNVFDLLGATLERVVLGVCRIRGFSFLVLCVFLGGGLLLIACFEV